ncbi:MAG: hypothetical protein AAB263_18065 [Planctomycetota bacterium]
MTTAVAIFLFLFGAFKLWLAIAAITQMRAWRAGVAGVTDPSVAHSKPWLFWAWVSWRLAAAALAIAVAVWLLNGPPRFG